MVDASTPQDRTLLACHDMLIKRLANDPVKYAYHSLAAGFISSKIHSKMLLSCFTPTDKANILMSAVRERIKSSPSAFHTFLPILLTDESLTNRDVVKGIVQRLESEGQLYIIL